MSRRAFSFSVNSFPDCVPLSHEVPAPASPARFEGKIDPTSKPIPRFDQKRERRLNGSLRAGRIRLARRICFTAAILLLSATSLFSYAQGLDDRPLGAPSEPSPGVRESTGNPSYQGSYARALRDLEEGRTGPAIRALDEIVARDPNNLGAWLDLAIAHCLAHDGEAAERIFVYIESRAQTPHAIADVIAHHRRSKCLAPGPRYKGFVSAGIGYASNLNLAPVAAVIWVPALDLPLTLADTSRPRDAAMTTIEAGGVVPLTADWSWTLNGLVQSNGFRGAGDYDMTLAQVSLGWRPARPALLSEAQISYAHLRLGGQSQIDALLLGATRWWPLGEGWQGGASLGVNQLNYTRLPTFDARQVEPRMRARWRGRPNLQITTDLGYLVDAASANRPGGDRSGLFLELRTAWIPSPGHTLELQLRHARTHDSAPYSPLFFGDTRRATRLSSLQASWRLQLSAALAARMEFRGNRSRDAIALFDHDAQSLTVSLEWALGR